MRKHNVFSVWGGLCAALVPLVLVFVPGVWAVSADNVIDMSDDSVINGAKGTGWTYWGGIYTIDGDVTVKGDNQLLAPAQRRLAVAANASVDITLDGVSITGLGYWQCALRLNTSADVVLTLEGENTLISGTNRAGLEVPANAALTIGGAGRLTAGSTGPGAGIGGGNGRGAGAITVTGGTVTADSVSGQDIGHGSGYTGPLGTTTITGGLVLAVNGRTTPRPTNGSLIPVYLNTLTVGTTPVLDKAVTSASVDGIAMSTTADVSDGAYVIKDVMTDSSGKVYFWLPQNASTDASVSVTVDGNEYMETWPRTSEAETQTLKLKGIGCNAVNAGAAGMVLLAPALWTSGLLSVRNGKRRHSVRRDVTDGRGGN